MAREMTLGQAVKGARKPPKPAKDWLTQCATLSAKAKRTLTPEGAAQHEYDVRAVARMRELLADRQRRIDDAR